MEPLSRQPSSDVQSQAEHRQSQPMRGGETWAQHPAEFDFRVHLDHAVDPSTAKVFTDVLTGVQAMMNQVAKDQARARTEAEQIRREVDALQRERDALKAEIEPLRREAEDYRQRRRESPQQQYGGGYAPPQQAPGPTREGHGTKRPDSDAPYGASPPGAPAAPLTPPPAAAQGAAFTMDETLHVHERQVHSVCVSSSGLVATASWDGHVKIINLNERGGARRQVVADLYGEGEEAMGGLYAVEFAKTQPDLLACTSADKSIYIWDHRRSTLQLRLDGHTDEVNGLDFHPEQEVMASASDDMKVIVWDFGEGTQLRQLGAHTKAAYGACFLGQEHQYLVATCCFDLDTRIFDMRDRSVTATFRCHNDDVIGIAYTGTTRTIATGSDDGTVCLIDTRMWRTSSTINTRTLAGDGDFADNEVKRVAFSADGSLLAVGCSTGSVLVYDTSQTQRPELLATLGGHQECVFDVAWYGGEGEKRTLISASHDYTSQIWRERPQKHW